MRHALLLAFAHLELDVYPNLRTPSTASTAQMELSECLADSADYVERQRQHLKLD